MSWNGVVGRLVIAWKQALEPMLYLLYLGTMFWLRFTWALLSYCVFHYKITLSLLVLLRFGMFLQMLRGALDTYAWYSGPYDYMDWSLPQFTVNTPTLSCAVHEPQIDWNLYYLIAALGGFNLIMILAVVALIMKPNRVERVCDHGFKVEKAVDGSAPVKSEAPSFIATVYTEQDGKCVRTQTAFRVGNRIFTAHHGLVGRTKAWLRYNDQIKQIDLSALKELDLDLVCFSYTPFSRFSMGSGKFATESRPQYCKVHNGDFEVYGRTEPAFVVGMLDFDGTTLPSYSGAPYFAGSKIFGMHVGGGVGRNTGFDAAFISALLTTYVQESNDSFTTDPEELYKEMNRKGEDLEYRNMGNDYYTVKVGGRFRMYDEETFQRIKNRYYTKNTGQARYEPEAMSWEQIKLLKAEAEKVHAPSAAFAYQDAENSKGPAADVTPVAGPSCEDPTAPVKRETTEIPTPVCHTPPPTGVKSTPMPGPTLLAAQQNALSRITLTELQYLIEMIQRTKLSVTEMKGLQLLARESNPMPA